MWARMMLAASEAAPAAAVLAEVVAIAPRDATLSLQVARLLGAFGRYDDALRQVRPDGIDLSSGVESAAGKKDAALVSRLVAAVRASEPQTP